MARCYLEAVVAIDLLFDGGLRRLDLAFLLFESEALLLLDVISGGHAVALLAHIEQLILIELILLRFSKGIVSTECLRAIQPLITDIFVFSLRIMAELHFFLVEFKVLRYILRFRRFVHLYLSVKF